MAKIREIIERVDDLRPNSFKEKLKLSWLSELEGKIAANVMHMSIEEIRALEYVWPDAMEAEPLVTFPHQDIYVYWLEAKVDYANGEYNKYQNSMEMYNQHYTDFVRWFTKTYEPAKGYPEKSWTPGWEDPPYYLTAYGLAVKAGFTGTIDQWLDSLRGEQGQKGDTGKSAYEFALEGGFEGTEEEFAAKLAAEFVNVDNFSEVADSLNKHILNKENPHEVTPADIEAAEKEHTHSVDDLKDGADTLKKLLETGYLVLNEKQFGDSFPEDAPDGTLFFIPLEAVSS